MTNVKRKAWIIALLGIIMLCFCISGLLLLVKQIKHVKADEYVLTTSADGHIIVSSLNGEFTDVDFYLERSILLSGTDKYSICYTVKVSERIHNQIDSYFWNDGPHDQIWYNKTTQEFDSIHTYVPISNTNLDRSQGDPYDDIILVAQLGALSMNNTDNYRFNLPFYINRGTSINWTSSVSVRDEQVSLLDLFIEEFQDKNESELQQKYGDRYETIKAYLGDRVIDHEISDADVFWGETVQAVNPTSLYEITYDLKIRKGIALWLDRVDVSILQGTYAKLIHTVYGKDDFSDDGDFKTLKIICNSGGQSCLTDDVQISASLMFGSTVKTVSSETVDIIHIWQKNGGSNAGSYLANAFLNAYSNNLYEEILGIGDNFVAGTTSDLELSKRIFKVKFSDNEFTPYISWNYSGGFGKFYFTQLVGSVSDRSPFAPFTNISLINNNGENYTNMSDILADFQAWADSEGYVYFRFNRSPSYENKLPLGTNNTINFSGCSEVYVNTASLIDNDDYVNALLAKINNLETKIADKESNIANLINQFQISESENIALRARVANLEMAKTLLETELAEVRDSLSTAEMNYREVAALLENKVIEFDNLQRQYEELQNELNAVTQALQGDNAQLVDSYRENKQELDIANEKNKELEEENEKLKDELKKAQDAIDTLSKGFSVGCGSSMTENGATGVFIVAVLLTSVVWVMCRGKTNDKK